MFATALSLLISPLLSQSAPMDAFFIVQQSHFECLIRNFSVVTRQRGEPVWVDLRTCPPRVIRRLDSFPRFPRGNGPGAVDVMIPLTREQISCIVRNRNRLDRLRVPMDRSRYRLSFEACRR